MIFLIIPCSVILMEDISGKLLVKSEFTQTLTRPWLFTPIKSSFILNGPTCLCIISNPLNAWEYK
jgi:hypothetical protein